MTSTPTYIIAIALLSMLFLNACGEKTETVAANPAPNSSSATQLNSALKHISLSAKPESAQTISALKASSPKVGDPVVLQGRIGGKGNPFVAQHAALLLADDTVLEACDAAADDHCPKPWDYCCESSAKRLQNIVTIQVVDAENQVIKTELNGFDDVQAGSYLIVKGTVAASDGDNVIINIDGLFHDRQRTVVKKGAAKTHSDDDHQH